MLIVCSKILITLIMGRGNNSVTLMFENEGDMALFFFSF